MAELSPCSKAHLGPGTGPAGLPSPRCHGWGWCSPVMLPCQPMAPAASPSRSRGPQPCGVQMAAAQDVVGPRAGPAAGLRVLLSRTGACRAPGSPGEMGTRPGRMPQCLEPQREIGQRRWPQRAPAPPYLGQLSTDGRVVLRVTFPGCWMQPALTPGEHGPLPGRPRGMRCPSQAWLQHSLAMPSSRDRPGQTRVRSCSA